MLVDQRPDVQLDDPRDPGGAADPSRWSCSVDGVTLFVVPRRPHRHRDRRATAPRRLIACDRRPLGIAILTGGRGTRCRRDGRWPASPSVSAVSAMYALDRGGQASFDREVGDGGIICVVVGGLARLYLGVDHATRCRDGAVFSAWRSASRASGCSPQRSVPVILPAGEGGAPGRRRASAARRS